MKKHIFLGLLALSMFGPLAAGCSSEASEDAEGSDESDYRKKPKGSENWASLTVQLPTGSCQPGGNCARPLGQTANITLDGAAVTLGAANRVKPGEHVLAVNNVSTKVNLAAGATKTMVLPTAHRKCQADGIPNLPQTDFGRSVALANAACPSAALQGTVSSKPTVTLYTYNWNCPAANLVGSLSNATTTASCPALGSNRIYSINVDGACINLTANRADGQSGISTQEACSLYAAGDVSWARAAQVGALIADYDTAFVPGDFSYVVGAETRTFKLDEGDTAEITMKLPVVGSVPGTFGAALTFAEPRELADAKATTVTSSCGGDRTWSAPAGSLNKVNLKAFEATNCVYTLTPGGGRGVQLSQSNANPITLKRFDVDDVEITRENGSTYTVKGTYELYFGGALVAGPFPTNTGIDLLPGTYEVVTKFSTADGPQVQRENIAF